MKKEFFSHRQYQAQQGAAIIMVLSMLVIVSLLVVGFAVVSSLESRSARNFLRNTQGQFLINMGLTDAMIKIAAGTPKVGTNYYWVSAPGRIWRVGGSDAAGATNRLAFSNYSRVASGYINLFSENLTDSGGTIINAYGGPLSTNTGFSVSNIAVTGNLNHYVNLNSLSRGTKICADPDPAVTGVNTNYIPINVAWINVARNPTLPISTTNPRVGRYAYWVDVENARLNINDIHERPANWRGLSTREIDARVLGITPSVLDTYRSPTTSLNLWGVTNARNANYFRRPEDIRAAGISVDTLRLNSFYLTAAGRNDEVDNAGRIPLKITDYNGNPTNAVWPSGFGSTPAGFTNNHPMASWNDPLERPSLSGKSYLVGGTVTNYSTNNVTTTNTISMVYPGFITYLSSPYTVLEIDFTALGGTLHTGPGAFNASVDEINISGLPWSGGVSYNPNTWTTDEQNGFNADISGAGATIKYEFPDTDISTNITSTGGDNPISANYFIPSQSSTFTNSQDWLSTRLVLTNTGGFPLDLTNRAQIAMNRLLQTNNAGWFVATNTTDTNGQGGKYTWNEYSQILANINTWRQTNQPFFAKGTMTFNYRLPLDLNNITNILDHGVSFAQADNQIITRGNTTYGVSLAQNHGSRPLPYINEIGFTIRRLGDNLQDVTMHMEMWNPSYPFEQMKNIPYNLQFVVVMPETAYTTGTSSDPNINTNYPSSYWAESDSEKYWSSGGVGDTEGRGDVRSPERYKTRYGRIFAFDGSTNTGNPGGRGLVDAQFWGSLWVSPGGSQPYAQGRTFSASGLTAQGGGYMAQPEIRSYVLAHASRALGRWHLPLLNQDSGSSISHPAAEAGFAQKTFILANAHLVDWRIPQHVDLGIYPRNLQTTLSANGIHGGTGFMEVDDNPLNLGVIVGVAMITNNILYPASGGGASLLNEIQSLDRFPSMASGAMEGDNRAPFYQIVPQPRVNPRDGNNQASTYGIPQHKFLIFPDITTSTDPLGVTVSRQVVDPRVNGRAAFVDWTLRNSSERNNLVNTYDANDWMPMSTAHTLNNSPMIAIDNFDGPDQYGAVYGTPIGLLSSYTNWFEITTGPLLTRAGTGIGSGWSGASSRVPNAGTFGRINSGIMTNTPSADWRTQGTNWSIAATSGTQGFFDGWGDGDGDLTSHLYKQSNYEHPAELGYVHSGRPWRTLRFGRTGTNTFEANQVPDWYLFDQFAGTTTPPDNAEQAWTRISTNKPVGSVGNPRRGMLALNPAIYTADPSSSTDISRARLKPLLALLTNVVTETRLFDVAEAVYAPSQSIPGTYTGYSPGNNGDRFGIPGVLDSPGELCEVFGRLTNTTATVRASAPYTHMVTNVWGGTAISLSTTNAAHTASGAQSAFETGWSNVSYNSGVGVIELPGNASATPKELLRASGLMMSPRSSHFRVYIVAQMFNQKGEISGEFWKEVLVERDNGFNESGNKPEYRIVWERNL